MKTKYVFWGENSTQQKMLIAISLRADDNEIDILTLLESDVNEELYKKMTNDWVKDLAVDIPDTHTKSIKQLAVTEGLLPEGWKAEDNFDTSRIQNEWHFLVLSTKLTQSYHEELTELRSKVSKLKKYEKETWERLKEFWAKVIVQVHERNISKEQEKSLRKGVDDAFETMKSLRTKLNEEFREGSKAAKEFFMTAISEIESRVGNGDRLKPLFDELVNLQRQYREANNMTREDRDKVWKKLDGAIKNVKKKLFPDQEVGENNSVLSRLKRRYDGLIKAIERMEKSIKRDEGELDFQQKKIDRSHGQLESQMRQAKIGMVENRINSKKAKLDDMGNTKVELEKRLEKEQKRQAKREEQKLKDKQRKEAEAEAKKKIADQIKANSKVISEDDEALKLAAQKISEGKKKTNSKADKKNIESNRKMDVNIGHAVDVVAETSDMITTLEKDNNKEETVEEIIEDMIDSVSETVEDGIDTAKAISSVIIDNIKNVIEDINTEKDKDANES